MQRKKIFLMRHGESWANIGDKTVVDAPLTAKGREQCSQVCLDVDFLICSPMRRTVESLHYSKINFGDMVFNPLFREKRSEIADHCLLEPFQPETEDEFYARSKLMARELLNLLREYDTIAVVCHGLVINSLTGIMPDNAEVVVPDLNILKSISDGEHYYSSEYY